MFIIRVYLKAILLCSIGVSSIAFTHLNAQQYNLSARADSLLNKWNDPNLEDSVRLDAFHNYINENYINSQPDSAIILAEIEYEQASEKGLQRQMANALYTIAIAYSKLGDNLKAIDYTERSAGIYESIGFKRKWGGALFEIGQFYNEFSDYTKALNNYMKALKIFEEINYEKGISNVYNGIGILYLEQEDYKKSFEFFEKSFELNKDLDNDFGQLIGLGNMGLTRIEEGNYEEGIEYFKKSIEISKKMGNDYFLGIGLNNLGVTYKDHGDFGNANKYYFQSLELREKIGDKSGVARTLSNIGDVYFEKKEYKKALNYCTKALNIAEEIDDIDVLKDIKWSLWEIHKKLGNYKVSLEMHEDFIQLRDSIRSDDKETELAKQEYKYLYEKKSVTDSIKNAEAQKLKDAKIAEQDAVAAKQELEIENKRNQQYGLFGGLFLVLVFAGFMYKRYRITAKQKDVIENQKLLVENAHEQLEEKSNEILDSIKYAKRLQDAILPNIEELKDEFPQSFVFFKPKDIVSGDFYWMERVGNHVFLAAADCTGHGVPGAMVSVVCANALHKVVNELKKTDPAEILDATRELVVATFAKSGSDVRDGMDISLVSLTHNFRMRAESESGEGNPRSRSHSHSHSHSVHWAGANNPLWIIRKGATEVEEIKADKQPIGLYGVHKEFTSHVLQLNTGDSFYLFSDGFHDQFGGDKGKKFKTKNFKKLLLDMNNEQMDVQKEKLAQSFKTWKGEMEQVDDLCVIGVTI